MLSIEQARSKTQEREIDRRRKQLEEITELIQRLQSELEDTRRVASGVKWELRENELRSLNEAEIIHYRWALTFFPMLIVHVTPVNQGPSTVGARQN